MSMPNMVIITFHDGNANGKEAYYGQPLPEELKFHGHFYKLKEGTTEYHWDGEL